MNKKAASAAFLFPQYLAGSSLITCHKDFNAGDPFDFYISGLY